MTRLKKIGKRTATTGKGAQRGIRYQLYEDAAGNFTYKYYGRMKSAKTGKWVEVLLEDCDSPLEAKVLLDRLRSEQALTLGQKRELNIDRLIELADQKAKKTRKKKFGISSDNHIIIRRHIRPYWDATDPDQKKDYPTGKSMTSFDMAEFHTHLEKKGLAPQTIKHCLLTASKLLRAGDLSFVVPDVSIENKKDFRFSDEQIKAMFTNADRRGGDLPDLLMFFSNTGCRRSELIRLRWEDVDFERDTIMFRKTKNGSDHTIPLNAELKSVLLKRKLRTKESSFVFAGVNGGMRSQSALSRLFSRLKIAAKLPEQAQPIHGLRSMFASRLSDSNVPLATIKELMNHREIQTTMRYVHASDETKKIAVEEMGKNLGRLKNGIV